MLNEECTTVICLSIRDDCQTLDLLTTRDLLAKYHKEKSALVVLHASGEKLH